MYGKPNNGNICADGDCGRPINQQLLDRFNVTVDEWHYLSLEEQEHYELWWEESNREGLKKFNDKYFGKNKYTVVEREKTWQYELAEAFTKPIISSERDMAAETVVILLVCIVATLIIIGK